MARVVNVAIGSLSALIGLALVAGGVVFVFRREVDPVTAAMIGGLALAVFEAGAIVVRLRQVRAVGSGTFGERVLVLAGVELGAIGVALLVAPASHPSAGAVVVGSAGLVVLATLVGAQVARS